MHLPVSKVSVLTLLYDHNYSALSPYHHAHTFVSLHVYDHQLMLILTGCLTLSLKKMIVSLALNQLPTPRFVSNPFMKNDILIMHAALVVIDNMSN